MIKKGIFFFLLLFGFSAFSQNLSDKATVSVLTCGAGENLYTAFGHSSFRIHDPVNGIDKVYNYGTFDTSQPNFYFHFVKGKMTYVLSVTTFDYFLREYKYFGRWVKMQKLNLELSDIQRVYNYLENNALPQNKAYQYDFYYENCATKIITVLKEVLKEKASFTNHHIAELKTHRQLLSDYTSKNFEWAGLGIDLVLGRTNDKKATKDEYQFLPDYVYQSVENATITYYGKKESLVSKSYDLLPQKAAVNKHFLTPFWTLLLFSLFVVYMTYANYKSQKISKWIDVVLHIVTGVIGLIAVSLWLGTNHTTTYSNFNVLWAFAPNILIALVFLKKRLPKWLNYYYKVLIVGVISSFLVWVFGVQKFNIAILPLLIALLIRYMFVLKKLSKLP